MGATLALIRDSFPQDGEKVVVLISDGGQQLGKVSPPQAALDLANTGMTLYVIAMGSEHHTSEDTEKGGLIYQPVNLPMLEQVARNGGGHLFHARDAQAFRDALSTIEANHRNPSPASAPQRLFQAWYPAPLALAMLLMLIASMLPPSRSLQATERQ